MSFLLLSAPTSQGRASHTLFYRAREKARPPAAQKAPLYSGYLTGGHTAFAVAVRKALLAEGRSKPGREIGRKIIKEGKPRTWNGTLLALSFAFVLLLLSKFSHFVTHSSKGYGAKKSSVIIPLGGGLWKRTTS